MVKQRVSRMKKVLTVLLAVLFVVSITASSVSAQSSAHSKNMVYSSVDKGILPNDTIVNIIGPGQKIMTFYGNGTLGIPG